MMYGVALTLAVFALGLLGIGRGNTGIPVLAILVLLLGVQLPGSMKGLENPDRHLRLTPGERTSRCCRPHLPRCWGSWL
jgi:hypothetical protein